VKASLLTSVCVFFIWFSTLPAQPAVLKNSSCLIFVDYDFIWTLELIKEKKNTTPVFNAVCLHRGQWELEPAEVRLFRGEVEYEVKNFSIDSGDPKKPYITRYLGMRGPDSVGVDLVGDFGRLDGLSEAVIELGRDRFILEALDCKEYDAKMDKIIELDMDGGNQVDDFQELGIQLFGRREAR
jgi:hypothetical protein